MDWFVVEFFILDDGCCNRKIRCFDTLREACKFFEELKSKEDEIMLHSISLREVRVVTSYRRDNKDETPYK